MKKSTYIILFFIHLMLSHRCFSQQVYKQGLIDLMPQGVTTSLTDLSVNNASTKLAGIGFYGKVYEFDISKPGVIGINWKANLANGFTNGGRIWYSSNNKYLLVQGMQSTMAATAKISFASKKSTWQGTSNVAVLDAANGNTIINVPDAYFVSIANEVAFISDKDGYKWYQLSSGKLLKEQAVSENECAAISPNGKYIVASWDAGRKTMAALESVNKRRTETKNATKSKKLLYIFDANNTNAPLYTSSDEVDVVTHIQFDTACKYAYLQVQATGVEQNTDMNNYVYQRVQLENGELDSAFSRKGNFYKQNLSSTITCGQYTSGTLGLLKQNRIQPSVSNTDTVIATFTTRYKLFNTSTLFVPMALHNSQPVAYAYYEKHLFEWNYQLVHNYFKKALNENDDVVIEKLKQELDDSFQNGWLAKQVIKYNIKGNYLFDITVVGPRALVQVIFCESDETTNISMQNQLKDCIKQQNFAVEIPKNQRIKFRYTINL
jgi:hypothetical protein